MIRERADSPHLELKLLLTPPRSASSKKGGTFARIRAVALRESSRPPTHTVSDDLEHKTQTRNGTTKRAHAWFEIGKYPTEESL